MWDSQFLNTVEELRVPVAGTELMAPLLYSLIRSTRPQSVLEIGMGYTTPFILRALEDNLAAWERDSARLREKTRALLAAGGGKEAEERWMETEPAGADPGYYLTPYEPHLYAFDDLSEGLASSSAQKVMGVIERLGLGKRLTFINGDPCGASERIAGHHLPIDLIWNDAARYEEFLVEYWDLLNPAGGLLLFHNTVNAWEENASVLKMLRKLLKSGSDDFELLNLVEPHKLNQRSFTMVRKISEFKESYIQHRRQEVQKNALLVLQSAK